ncbi:unnamed protein product [Urochloa humidicola]
MQSGTHDVPINHVWTALLTVLLLDTVRQHSLGAFSRSVGLSENENVGPPSPLLASLADSSFVPDLRCCFLLASSPDHGSRDQEEGEDAERCFVSTTVEGGGPGC